MNEEPSLPVQTGFDTPAWIESVRRHAETDYMDAEEWPDWPDGVGAEDFLRDCTLAFRDESAWATLQDETLDPLLIPLSSMLGLAIANTPEPFIVTKTCIETLPRFLYGLARRQDSGGGGFGYFLENVVFHLGLGIRPEARDSATLAALLDSMVRLLTAPSDHCQVLAIDGLGKIDLAEAREILERYRWQTPDKVLAGLARIALNEQR